MSKRIMFSYLSFSSEETRESLAIFYRDFWKIADAFGYNETTAMTSLFTRILNISSHPTLTHSIVSVICSDEN